MARELGDAVVVEVQAKRFGRRIVIDLPVNGPITLNAEFVRAQVGEGDVVLQEESDGGVVLNDAEVRALPSFAAAYAELHDAVHDKREAQDNPPAPVEE